MRGEIICAFPHRVFEKRDQRALLRKFFQTLRPNYSDEMAQFVFDIAGHSDCVGNLLAQ
jgi:hypothetical protein